LKFKINKILSAVSYSSIITLVDQLLLFFRGVILARLLLPEHFGTFGVALAISSSLQVLSDFGIKPRFISLPPLDQEDEKKWLESIWTVELIRGLVLCFILAASAQCFAEYFNDNKLMPVIMIVSLVPIFGGLSSPRMFVYEKKFQYGKIATREILASIGGFVLTIILAYLTKSAVALALGLLSQVIIGLMLSYLLAPFRPKLLADKQILLNCYHYGKHLLVVSVLTYITTQVDNLFVGKLSGPEALGFYLVAYSLAMTPVTLVQIVSRVALPFYSEAWSNGHRVLAYQRWTKTAGITTFIVAGITIALWSGRNYLIPFVYGEAWMPATPVFAVLLFVGFFRGMTHTMSPMLRAMERNDIDAKVKMVEAVLFVSLLSALVPTMGMMGAAYAGLASYILAFGARLVFFIRPGEAETRQLLKDYAICGLCFGLTIVVMEYIHNFLHEVINIIAAFIIFAIISLILNRRFRE